MEKKTKRVKVTRMIYEHGYLGSIAMNQLDKAREEGGGHRFRWLIPSMVFSVFRIEALCNLYGSQLFPHWGHFESTSFLGKVTMISEFLKIKVDFSAEPWQTLNRMKHFRNALAHAKPQKASRVTEIPENAPDQMAFYPKSNKTITSYSSIEAAEQFDRVADEIEGLWLYHSDQLGYQVDTAGRPEYQVIEDVEK
jgi:hypothetical protein